MKYLLFILLAFLTRFSFGQKDSSSTESVGQYETTNKVKSKFWGNSTSIATSINFSKCQEYKFNIGRSYGHSSHSVRGLGSHEISSWGLGYSFSNRNSQTINAYYDFDFCPTILIGNIGLRGEYMFDFKNNQSYLRPSIGWSFVYLNILYNYSFKLNGAENMYKHGLTVRLKYFLFRKNWEESNYIGY